MKNLLKDEITKGINMALSHGRLYPGKGMISGMIALFLANLSLFGVIMLQFPDYLTTPRVRDFINIDVMRILVIGMMLVCGSIALFNIIFDRVRRLSSWALWWLVVAIIISIMGSYFTGKGWLAAEVVNSRVPYLGVDWLILDLIATTLLFTSIEKLHPLKKELPVFRKYWQTDFMYFVTGHLFVGLTLFIVYAILYGIGDTADHLAPVAQDSLRGWIRNLPFIPALLLLMLITDMGRYWLHRFYHETEIGWRLHAIHHSAEDMDWISGSRTHGIETVISTVVILLPGFLLGFDHAVVNVYILIAGLQAVFNHTNTSVRLGPLRYFIVTPNFHHWHHTRDKEGIDRCYAAHFAFLDYLFGTAVETRKEKIWPNAYGVIGDYVPQGFWAQQIFPFVWKGFGRKT